MHKHEDKACIVKMRNEAWQNKPPSRSLSSLPPIIIIIPKYTYVM